MTEEEKKAWMELLTPSSDSVCVFFAIKNEKPIILKEGGDA